MAYIEGFPAKNSAKSLKRHLAFIALVMIAITGFMFNSDESLMEQLSSSFVPLIIILAIMLYVSFKVNPAGWKKIIDKEAYLKNLEHDSQIAEMLMNLDDTHYIIHNINFELFQLNFVVISPTGIFVIDKTKAGGPLEIREDILFQNNRTLETLTGSLWRLCHLINIVLKKGYEVDVMPQPVLVIPDTKHLDVDNYDGISIVTPSKLTPLIAGVKKEVLKPEIAQGFAYYIKERYGPKK